MTVDVPFSDAEVTQAFGNALKLQDDHKGRLSLSGRYTTDRTSGLRLQKAITEVQDGTRKSFRILTIGDSLASTTWDTVNNQLARAFAGWLQSTPIYANTIGALEAGPDGDDVTNKAAAQANYNLSISTGTFVQKADYDVSFDGQSITLSTGEIATFSEGGNSVIGDRLLIPIITEPGAGSVKIELSPNATPPSAADGSWRDVTAPEITSGHSLTGSELIVDADTTFGVAVVELSVDLGTWNVKVSHEAGSDVRMQFVMHEVATAAAVNNWRLSSSASNSFTNASATAEPVVAGIIAAYDPDIIVIESDDSLAAYQNFLPILEDTITAASLTHAPFVLLVGGPFYDNTPLDDDDLIERIDYCWDFTHSRVGWDVLDGMAYVGGLEEANAAGWSSDGIHYETDTAWYITKRWALERGVYPVEEKRPGGDATRADVLSAGGRRVMTPSVANVLAMLPAVNTDTLDWDSKVTNSGVLQDTGNYKRLVTQTTADSTVVAHISTGSPPIARGPYLNAECRGFSAYFKTTTPTHADMFAFVGIRSEVWNAGYLGELAGTAGFGFRMTGGVLEGVCIDNTGSLAVSPESVTLTTVGNPPYYQVACFIDPYNVDASNGTIEWFVDSVSLGKSPIKHSNMSPPRIELTNGATASNAEIHVGQLNVLTLPL